jgi:hypothetical protein
MLTSYRYSWEQITVKNLQQINKISMLLSDRLDVYRVSYFLPSPFHLIYTLLLHTED